MVGRRAAIYLRYSDRKQAERGGVSIADQLRKLRRAAAEAGDTIVKELEDQAKTATTIKNRPAYNELLSLARAGEIDVVWCEEVNRANRNEHDRYNMEADLARYGVEMQFLGETRDMPEETRRLTRAVSGALSENEIYTLSQRVYSRSRFLAEKGSWRGGRIRYGTLPDGKGWLKPDPETYPILLWILQRRADSWGSIKTAAALNKGISIDGAAPSVPPTPSLLEYRRRPYVIRVDKETGEHYEEPRAMPSGVWHQAAVESIWKEAVNGVYAGVLNWGGNDHPRFPKDKEGRKKQPVRYDQHPPLVPEELLAAVRAVEADARGKHRGGRPSTFLLRPICGNCGRKMFGRTRVNRYTTRKGPQEQKYRFYYCSSQQHGSADCRMWSVSANWLEAYVLNNVSRELQAVDPDTLARELQVARERIKGELLADIEALQQRITNAERVKEDQLDTLTRFGRNLSEAVQSDLIKRANDTAAEVIQLQREIKNTEAGLKRLEERAAQTDMRKVEPLLRPDQWQDPDQFDALKRALDLIVCKVVVQPERETKKGIHNVDVKLCELGELFLV